ncbi:hypothetical protein GCM10010116_50590 [Microbispora rosea subsp. aerata]|nr:DUF6049 family protein [Microbispora rosea]GGO25196.1 hypothetical protein GCM10010116_50590 [Microbispora rosea subsp. aerata]GIH58158.1 hypothetical protein Mro02_50720 [Microbispora rosea subsp. aerata]GLJ85240.1 hypothetical protein GCM10017588_39690 [Microbispora rosea subsp. aerata]
MIRKAALLTLLTALLASPAGMAGTAVAAAPGRVAVAAPADPLFVSEITPEVVRDASAPVKVAGTVSGTPGSYVRIAVRYSRDRPFASRAEMAAYLAEQGYVTTNWSTRVQATPVDQSGKLPFEFTVTPAELGMPRPGVYPFEIEVTDSATGQRLGIERTFLTYAPKGEQIPKVKLAVALPIVDRPHRADDGTFMDDDLSASLTSGRLASLLQTVQDTGAGVTWFVDPALLDDVRVLSSGPRSVRGTRKNADAAAGQWLNGLRSALTDKTVLATPYADPDVTALVHNGLDKQAAASVQRGAALASELLGRQIPGTTAWPAGGKIDRDAVDELAMSGVTSVLLSGDALPPRPAAQDATQTGQTTSAPGQITPDGAARLDTVADDPLTALLADPTLSELLGGDVSAPGAAMLARQRFLAETAMIAFEQQTQRTQQGGQLGRTGQTAAAKTASRTVIAAPGSHLWTPDPAFVSGLLQAASAAPWLRMTTLDSVKPGRAGVPRGDLTYTDRDRQAELSRSYLATVRRLERKANAVATVTAEHTDVFHTAILRLASASWRGDAKRATAFAAQVQKAIDDRMDDVSVLDTPRAVAGSNGQVPVSVANNLDKDIQVKIRVTSASKSRLAIDTRDGVYVTPTTRILAGRSQLVNVPVIIRDARGDASISVQLLTDGDEKYGSAVRVVVRATGYTGIALVIVGAAVVIMLAAVVMRILRRRSRKAFPFDGPDGADGPPSGETGAVSAERTQSP